MQTGRTDLDAMLKVSSIPATEPVFVIRAQDSSSGDTVRSWAGHARSRGAPAEVLEQALQQADRMDAWPIKKVPDSEHLVEHQAQNLRYEFQRRCARNGEDLALATAVERGSPPADPVALLRRIADDYAQLASARRSRATQLERLANSADTAKGREASLLEAAAARQASAYYRAAAQAQEAGAAALEAARG